MLTEKEIEIINNFIQISKLIYDGYVTIYNLEITNQKDSKEYLEKCDKLKELLEKENMLYSTLPFNDPYKMRDFISYLESKSKELTNIYKLDDTKHIERVYVKLLTLTCKFGPKYTKEAKNKNKLICFNLIYLEDINNAFSYYLDEEINAKENEEIKNKLKLFQYRFNYQEAYTKDDNELFRKSEGLVIYANGFMRKNNLSDKVLDKFNKQSQTDIADSLFKIRDLNKNFVDNKAEIIARICHIKASLLVLSNHRYNEISDHILKLTEKLRLLYFLFPLELKYQSELCDLFEKTITDVNKDRKRLIIH